MRVERSASQNRPKTTALGTIEEGRAITQTAGDGAGSETGRARQCRTVVFRPRLTIATHRSTACALGEDPYAFAIIGTDRDRKKRALLAVARADAQAWLYRLGVHYVIRQ